MFPPGKTGTTDVTSVPGIRDFGRLALLAEHSCVAQSCTTSMIWYLLYPLRGTTEAPVLDPSHPIRDGFTRYGRYAARHAVTTLLVSVAVATSLIYPIPFLFTNDFTNGASNLPHHVWTDAKPLAYDSTVEPDVIMRSIWVHGSYMKALDTELLSSALELQNALLGPTEDFSPRQNPSLAAPNHDSTALSPTQRDAFHVINGLTNASWFFHSPLLYWGCSRDRILADGDIISTVNDRKNQSTSVNVTLRHSIVFSGKRFEDRRLLAADALVVTLLHLRDSPVGRQWEARALELAHNVKDKWDIYPPDGRISASQLFEFQFRPMSFQDIMLLTMAYGLTLLYFVISLSKLRAFKSKVGLMVTVMCQSALAVISSFTICAIFNIDLSRIPQAAYPLVILSMSLENIFRLINSVIIHSSEENTSDRIGHAFGETAHIAVASTLQNALILSALSRIVSPGVAAFCIFATVAIVLDFFFLSTFFLSVLSVDVRRTELSDALAKVSSKTYGGRVSDIRGRTSWIERILQGKIALSTRVAGTVVMVGFVLIAQWHFFDDENIFGTLLRAYRKPRAMPGSNTARGAPLENIHQARSLTSWLRLQDHETAREVINIIKPSSYSYTARVYEPLVFVMKNSDRMPRAKEGSLLPAAYDFIHHQLTRFFVMIIVVIAAIRLLTSYLLWEDEASIDDQHDPNETTLLSVKSLSGGHALDVAMLAASSDGHVVSVGLDRLIRVWDVRSGGPSYVITDGNQVGESTFPVLAMAIDDASKWLAILSSFQITLWNLVDRKPGPSVPVDNCGQKPEAIFFLPETPSRPPKLILIRRNGTLTELEVAAGAESEDFVLCSSPLISVQPLIIKDKGLPSSQVMVVAAARKGALHLGTRGDSTWGFRSLQLEELEGQEILQLVALPSLRHVLVSTIDRVYLVSVDEPTVTHIFHTDMMQPRSLKCAYTRHRSPRPNALGLTMLSLGYTAAETGECLSQTYVPAIDSDAIALERNNGFTVNDGWCSWQAAKEVKKRVKNPGAWKMLPDGSVVGVRRRVSTKETVHQLTGDGKLRRRTHGHDKCKSRVGCWEVWTISGAGKMGMDECRPLFREDEKASHLIISELGPHVKVGRTSIAVGFGNMIKLVTLGYERFDSDVDETNREPLLNVGSRRRKPSALTRVRTPTAWP
ncbi:Sterol regulatory element-binding protein [Paramyrothecium foliicola]|nr:Sterol regulatory element-binding protein [Paramyrothecium foliicola]